MRNVSVCDTTLRDCEHMAEFTLSVREKVEIAKQLERLGVDIIEVGARSDALIEISREIKSVIFSVACRLSEFHGETAQKALSGAAAGRVNFLLNENRPENYVKELNAAIKEAKALNLRTQVTVDALSLEDGDFLESFCGAVKLSGADGLCVYDDAGYVSPEEFSGIVEKTVDVMGNIAVSVKCKNDLGLAVANALSAVRAGASGVECSVNGIGRRAGNASLEQIVMGLSAREDYYGAKTGVVKKLLYRTSRMVSAVVGQPIAANRPIVGDGALTRYTVNIPDGAGFKPIGPEEVGIFRNNLLLGTHTSESVFMERVTDLGYLLSREQTEAAYKEFMKLAEKRDAVSDRDIEAIAAPLDDEAKRFELVNFVINSGTMFPSTATIIMRVNSEEKTAVSAGLGPVDASFKAIDSITGMSVSLDDFSLQSVTQGEDALGDAVLKVNYNDCVFTGRGVSTDIVESAIRAYVNALNKAAAVS